MPLTAIDIQLLQKKAHVAISYDNGVSQQLSCGDLHKDDLNIISIDIIHDTISFIFNDGFKSPYYSWQELYAMR